MYCLLWLEQVPIPVDEMMMMMTRRRRIIKRNKVEVTKEASCFNRKESNISKIAARDWARGSLRGGLILESPLDSNPPL